MSMAPNAVSIRFAVCDSSCGHGVLILSLDYSVWFWLCHLEHCDYALLLSRHGSGLSGVGLLVVGYWPLPVSDFRCGGWYSSVSLGLFLDFRWVCAD
jgi:hypothetical protein